MRVIGLWAMLMIVLYALQTSLLTFISFDGFSANLMLLLTVSIAFLRGNKYGAFSDSWRCCCRTRRREVTSGWRRSVT